MHLNYKETLLDITKGSPTVTRGLQLPTGMKGLHITQRLERIKFKRVHAPSDLVPKAS